MWYPQAFSGIQHEPSVAVDEQLLADPRSIQCQQECRLAGRFFRQKLRQGPVTSPIQILAADKGENRLHPRWGMAGPASCQFHEQRDPRTIGLARVGSA